MKKFNPLPFEITVMLEDIGQGIAYTRKQRGLSQRVFADMLGIAPATLVSLEKGLPTVQIGYYAIACWMLQIPFVSGLTVQGIQL